MDVGVALIPGGNNGPILAALPALSPGGTAASLLMTTTIVLLSLCACDDFPQGTVQQNPTQPQWWPLPTQMPSAIRHSVADCYIVVEKVELDLGIAGSSKRI